ncbi:MAG: hypothetical protein BAJALOKI1v1_2450001 [Promethearchaeota archaeon]|nr:MAG: hypothetical protein BAJALOKI1v1_2450001 [Candidatus Lokiarchaeota archaeon]
MKFNIQKFLKNNVKPAMGCTEVVAIGYAVSLAYHALFNTSVSVKEGHYIFPHDPPEFDLQKLNSLQIKTDRDVYKNAFAVAIPRTKGQKGAGLAAAIGIYCNPKDKLNIFQSTSDEIVIKAKKILRSGLIRVEYVKQLEKKLHLDIRVLIKYRLDDIYLISKVRIQDEHDNVTLIEVNNRPLFKGARSSDKSEKDHFPDSIEEILKIAKSMDSKDKEIVYEGILMNKKVAEVGLKGGYGTEIGKYLYTMAKDMNLEKTLLMQVRINAAAAADARMGGCNLPVMSTSGSGNQGITALLPIAVIGEIKDITYDKLCEAALISHLLTKLTHLYSTHLSALCGCAIKAGIGATAGITFLLGGTLKMIHQAINLLAANITGMICDGAKAGCALKISTASGVALECALMAINGANIASDNGIIFSRAEDTIKAIGKISDSLMETDLTIINIMKEKQMNRDTSNKHIE